MITTDDIVSDDGALIGHGKLDSEILGCFEYASHNTIVVYPVSD